MSSGEDPKTEELRQAQAKRETTERELAGEAKDPAEQRQHKRRADKAAFLKEKLAARERSEREAG